MLLLVRYLDRNGAHLKSRGDLWQGRDDDKPACVEAAEDVRSLVLPLLYGDWCTPTFRKCSYQPFISQNPSIFPISWSQPMKGQYLDSSKPMRVDPSDCRWGPATSLPRYCGATGLTTPRWATTPTLPSTASPSKPSTPAVRIEHRGQ